MQNGIELIELNKVYNYTENINLKDVTIWNLNSVLELVQIANLVLVAKIESQRNNYAESIALLRKAIIIEDTRNYNEPPDWFFSVRHELGSVLLQAGLPEQAIETYEEDLLRLPKNGWALSGLSAAYEAIGKEQKRAEVQDLFDGAWSAADITLANSVVLETVSESL